MKKSTKPFSLVIILLFAFALVSCIPRGTKYVVLLVNTEDIGPDDEPKDFSSFPDQKRESDSLYTTHVKREDSVVWLGLSITSPLEDEVVIDRIVLRRRPESLGTAGDDGIPGDNGRVIGIINENAKRRKVPYTIHFTVNGQPYILDPILRVH